MKINSVQDLGALVRTQRKKRGWTQEKLSSQVGVRPLWISQFERGKTTGQIGLVLRTLKALELSLSVGDSKLSGGGARVVDLDSLVQPITEPIITKPGESPTEAVRRTKKAEKKGAGK